MNLRLARAFACFATILCSPIDAMAASHLIYLGTYTRNSDSTGIYAVRLDDETGRLTAPEVVATAIDPAWVALSPDKKFLYTLHASAAQAIGFRVDPKTARLTPLPVSDAAAVAKPASPPSHLAVDATGKVLLAANYRDGFVAAMPIRSDGTLGTPHTVPHEGKGPHPTRQEKAHVHSVTPSPDNRFVIVADLGLDKIFTYALEPAAAKLTPSNPAFVAAAPGAGPRHFKFAPDGRHAYAINELNSTVTAYNYEPNSGRLTPTQSLSTLPSGATVANTTAEVRVHPSGRFVYGSNRGDDSIAVFAVENDGKLNLVEITKSGGKTPRNFSLSPDGRWLVCGHQDTPLITVFRVDPSSGKLTATSNSAPVPSCVCVLFYD